MDKGTYARVNELLNELHTLEDERILIDVELESGGTAEAWIYSLRR